MSACKAGVDLQRYAGSLGLELIRGLIGKKIREQENLIAVWLPLGVC